MATGTATVLLTRPRAASERFATCLGPDVPVLIAPLVEIEPVGGMADPQGFAAVVLTSANAVARLKPGTGIAAYCVGDRTGEAARGAGFAARSASGDAEALFRMIEAAPPRGPVLYARGADSRGDLAARLRGLGLSVEETVVYRQADRAPSVAFGSLVGGTAPVVAPVFSPLAAERLAAAAPARAGLSGVAISDAAASPLTEAGWPVTVAAEPTAAAVRRAVMRAISGA